MNDPYATAAELELMRGFPPPADKRVKKSNAFWTPPYNRWSYQNMRMFFPSQAIRPASEPWRLPTEIDDALDRVSIHKPNERGEPTDVAVDLETYMRETYTDALIVTHEGKITCEKYLNGMTPGQPHQMMSVTKSFAGLFALMAAEDGLLDEQRRIGEYLPELRASSAFADATLGQVLDMTNSMRFNEDYVDPDSDVHDYVVVVGLNEPSPNKTYADSIYDYLSTLQHDPKRPHGKVFHYQTPKVDVANWVLNRETHLSYGDYLHRNIWSSIGATGENYVLLDANATLFASGGLNANPMDLARFGAMLANQGSREGRSIVSPRVVRRIMDGASKAAFSAGPNAVGVFGSGDWSYRAYWWVRHTPGKEAFMASGIHGQWIYVDPLRDISIIKQSSQPDSETEYGIAYDVFGFDAIVDRYS